MSWKGFKKAVNRLPYVISYKAGHTEKTVDEEFVEYLSQFDELKALSVKLHDAAKKYKDAAASMLKHQESFAKTLAEVYEPISGQKFGGNAGLSGVDFSKKSRALTNEDAMQVVHAYHEAAVDASAKLVPEMDIMIERRIIQPVHDWIDLHEHVQKTVAKRDRKLIDYDRHRESLKSAKEKAGEKGGEDPKKIQKLELAMDTAYHSYDAINGALKAQLPHYIQLRVPMIDPILEALVVFQEHFFREAREALSPMEAYFDMRLSIVDGYNNRKAAGIALLDDIPTLKTRVPEPGDLKSDGEYDDEFDTDLNKNPFRTESAINLHPPQAPPLEQSPFKIDPKMAPAPPSYRSAKAPLAPGIAAGGTSGSRPQAPAIASKPASLSKSASVANTAPPPAYGESSSTKANPPAQGPRKVMAVALYDFVAQQAGDLGFRAGDKIEVVERTDDVNGWWRGRLNGGQTGVFPGNYVTLQ